MIISSRGCSVKIVSKTISSTKLKRDLLANPLLYKFIPDLNFSLQSEKINLQIENQKRLQINFTLNQPFIYGKYNYDFNSTDIIVISEYLLEYLRQKQNICVIHSSAIYKNNKAILLFANLTGAGKTSLALYLNKKYGYKLFSDEKTLVDIKRIKLVGQTKKLFLENRIQNTLGYKLPKFINIKKAGDKKLCLLIVPVIIPSVAKTIIYKYQPKQLHWCLYEEFSKDIRLVNGLIINFSYPLQSLDNHQLATSRQKFVKKISSRVPCYCILGELTEVAKKINQIFESICQQSSADFTL